MDSLQGLLDTLIFSFGTRMKRKVYLIRGKANDLSADAGSMSRIVSFAILVKLSFGASYCMDAVRDMLARGARVSGCYVHSENVNDPDRRSDAAFSTEVVS